MTVLEKISELPPILVDACLSLTYSHFTKDFDRKHSVLGNRCLSELANLYRHRISTLHTHFGLSAYDSYGLANLLGISPFFVGCCIEKYGFDAVPFLNRKLLTRYRGAKTLFLHSDGAWHTPETFHLVYNTPKTTILADLRRGNLPIPWRSVSAADCKLRTIARAAAESYLGRDVAIRRVTKV